MWYTCYVPAPVLGLICIISRNPCKYLCKVGIIIPILQMWKPSHREGDLLKDHTARV